MRPPACGERCFNSPDTCMTRSDTDPFLWYPSVHEVLLSTCSSLSVWVGWKCSKQWMGTCVAGERKQAKYTGCYPRWKQQCVVGRASRHARWHFCTDCPTAVPVALWDCCGPKFYWQIAIWCTSICKGKEPDVFFMYSLGLKYDYWLAYDDGVYCWNLHNWLLQQFPDSVNGFLEGKLIS